MNKIHHHLVESAQIALANIIQDERPADKAIEALLKSNRKWGARDRRFLAETIYDCVRWWRRLEAVSKNLGLSRNEIVWIYGATKNWDNLPEDFPAEEALDEWRRLQNETRAVRESLPEWLDQMASSQLGSQWDEEIKALNGPAPVDLRVNTLKADRSVVIKELRKAEIEAIEIKDSPSGLTLKERKNVFVTEAFQKGFFEVQDRSSQHVGPFLQLEPGLRVVDACAGAGGKSLHMAALMKNKGKIISLDIHQRKLDELKIRSRRAGCDIIETRLIDSSKVVKRLEQTADRLLLDVPCTGLGVLRRNPDTKWKLDQEKYNFVTQTQREILFNYSKILRVGGLMVYATCSILPEENERQIQKFLTENPDKFSLEEVWNSWPRNNNGDGFFAARLKRIS